MKNILLVEDERMLTDSLVPLITRKLPGTNVEAVHDGKGAMILLNTKPYDLVILDLQLKGGVSGKDVADYIKSKKIEVKILILSATEGEALIAHIVSMGIAGFLRKNESGDSLITAIQTIFEGGVFMSGSIHAIVLRHAEKIKLPEIDLDPLESRLLTLLLDGKSAKEISDIMKIDNRRARYIKESLYLKTQTKTQNELLIFAFNNLPNISTLK